MDETVSIQCPFCGTQFSVAVDFEVNREDMVADCDNCCHPVHFLVINGPGGSVVERVEAG